MKLIIAGGRGYAFTREDRRRLMALHEEFPIEEVVSGGAPGADRAGEVFAASAGIPVKRMVADWETHGRAAGPRRNQEMAEYADAVALFPGGRGTEDMHRKAVTAGLRVFDFRKAE
jgi:hypothetical protein